MMKRIHQSLQKHQRTTGAAVLAVALMAGAGCDKGKKASLPDAAPAKPAAGETPAPAAAVADAPVADAPVGDTPVVSPSAPAAYTNLNQQPKGVHVISGQVFARQAAAIGFQVAGFIKSIAKDAGDTVNEGDVLAALDDTDAALQLQVAEARFEQAKAAFLNAKNEFEREKQLKAAAASSVSSFDLRRTAFDQAKAARDLAELEVKRATMTLDRTRLKAPFSGIISSRSKGVGEYVTSGQEVYSVVTGDKHEIRMQVPEQLLSSVRLGQKVAVSVPSVGLKAEAEIIRVVPVISDKTRSFLVYAQLSEDVKQVSPGLFVEAQITADGSH
jgi:multidrug efflux system membrane fusion protein